MNSYSAASDMGDIGMGHRSDCILQCLSDDFDQESDSQPPRLYASNVYDVDLVDTTPVSYTHLRAHETDSYLVCRLLLEKKK